MTKEELGNQLKDTRKKLIQDTKEAPGLKINFLLAESTDFPREIIHESMRPRAYLPPIENLLVSSEGLRRRWKGKGRDIEFVHQILRILGCYVAPWCRYISYYIDQWEQLAINTIKTSEVKEMAPKPGSARKKPWFIYPHNTMKSSYLKHLSIIAIESRYNDPVPRSLDYTKKPPGNYHNMPRGKAINDCLLLTNKANMIGFFQDMESNILAVDIDAHDNRGPFSERAQAILKRLIRHLGYPTPLFTERSLENGGYHAYFVMRERLYHSELDSIEADFNQQYAGEGMRIECRKWTKAIRMILSCTYAPIVLTNIEEFRDRITSGRDIDSINLDETILHSISDAFLAILSHDERPAEYEIPKLSQISATFS